MTRILWSSVAVFAVALIGVGGNFSYVYFPRMNLQAAPDDTSSV